MFELAPRSIRVEQGRSSFLLELKGSDEEHSKGFEANLGGR